MHIPVFIVDAFTKGSFTGNPAAVVPLDSWLPEETLQKMAAEHNQAETAFLVKEEKGMHIRWFTPTVEVDLCGHATLATSYVLWNKLGYTEETISFHSRSGALHVVKTGDAMTLDFPMDFFLDTEAPDKLLKGLRTEPKETYIGKTDYLCVFESEEKVRRIDPDFAILAEVRARGVIVTAPGMDKDFVYRFFGPQAGINEDPATGSAQTTLMPYWSKKLNRTELVSLQLSKRTGHFHSVLQNDRVLITGHAQLYLEGKIFMDDL